MELLEQIRLIDPMGETDRPVDLLLDGGKIQAIAQTITDYPPDTQIVSGKGLIVGRGLVDLYSHSGEPGNESRETLTDLNNAAMAGGFAKVAILPDTLPRLDNFQVVTALQQTLAHKTHATPRLNFWGAAIGANNTKQMNELAELSSAVAGFYGRFNLSNLSLFKQLLEYLQPWHKPLAIALEDNELTGNGTIREGSASIRYGMVGNPGCSESAIVAAVLEIVAAIPTPIHIMRISTQRSVELIAQAKQSNLPVTASVTWMHLLWDSDALDSYDPNLRLEPPLGNPSDQAALIMGIKEGIIDAIAIDHQAYTYEEKTVPFDLAPPGAIGLEIAFPLLWQHLVATKKLSAGELWRAMSINPLQCLQQQPLEIAPQNHNDLILFDPQKTWIANRANLKSPATNTPYYEQQITGKVIRNWN